MMPARQAAQTAEDARLVGLQRQEDAFLAEQKAQGLAREQNALSREQAEAVRRRQAELDTVTARAARDTAERDAQSAATARTAAELDSRTAAAGQAAAVRAAADADAARSAADAARIQAEGARAAAEAQALQADTARRAAELQAQQAQGVAAQSEQDKIVLREQLREQLNVILDTRETARGLIVNLSDVLFDTGSASLKPGAREKLARVSGILVSHPGLRLEVEGHTDGVGTDSYNQALSERRAESVRAYLVAQKIASTSVGAVGFGEGQPVATNGTAAGRQQNRRVELVVSGEIIGRR